MTSKTTTKFFAGFLLSSELNMHLKHSPTWKDLSLLDEASQELKNIHYENHHYIGQYLDEERLSLPEIKAHESRISQKLLSYCPKLDISHLKFSLISQLFIQ